MKEEPLQRSVTLLPGRYKGFLTGAALGFVVWMLVCVTGTDLGELLPSDLSDILAHYAVPAALILIGLILNAFGKGAEQA